MLFFTFVSIKLLLSLHCVVSHVFIPPPSTLVESSNSVVLNPIIKGVAVTEPASNDIILIATGNNDIKKYNFTTTELSLYQRVDGFVSMVFYSPYVALVATLQAVHYMTFDQVWNLTRFRVLFGNSPVGQILIEGNFSTAEISGVTDIHKYNSTAILLIRGFDAADESLLMSWLILQTRYSFDNVEISGKVFHQAIPAISLVSVFAESSVLNLLVKYPLDSSAQSQIDESLTSKGFEWRARELKCSEDSKTHVDSSQGIGTVNCNQYTLNELVASYWSGNLTIISPGNQEELTILQCTSPNITQQYSIALDKKITFGKIARLNSTTIVAGIAAGSPNHLILIHLNASSHSYETVEPSFEYQSGVYTDEFSEETLLTTSTATGRKNRTKKARERTGKFTLVDICFNKNQTQSVLKYGISEDFCAALCVRDEGCKGICYKLESVCEIRYKRCSILLKRDDEEIKCHKRGASN